MNTDIRQPLHARALRLEAAYRPLLALVRALARHWIRLQRSAAEARSRRELQALNDRTLKDIGLTRGQIDSMFR